MSRQPTPFAVFSASIAALGASVSGTTTITTITRGYRVWTVVQA